MHAFGGVSTKHKATPMEPATGLGYYKRDLTIWPLLLTTAPECQPSQDNLALPIAGLVPRSPTSWFKGGPEAESHLLPLWSTLPDRLIWREAIKVTCLCISTAPKQAVPGNSGSYSQEVQ